MENSEIYLRAMMSLVARQTFSPDQLADLVSPQRNLRAMQAFNYCDGTKTQGEIASELGLDSGNFSRTISRWTDEGIIIKIGAGKDTKPIHVYSIPDYILKASKKDNPNG